MTSTSGGSGGNGRLLVSTFDGIWRVRWEDGDEIHSSHSETEAWNRAKVIAQRARAEALLHTREGEVRLRADFRDDES